ncbi:neuropeptides capa receptor-like [Dreissena polymorpha]|uniref:G-protein coupled receptors family 1 profile domain-containing protein n=1 Tax=Dreissena polymorpha TaxID=45954 RepID=A0A9D4MQH8_DREPO|nr:neuropeptides capa receptor-like [Dreissena polymorpha]KAH3880673.1 hypothetical protein DPMN_004594 [Dreissena polymorpha]
MASEKYSAFYNGSPVFTEDFQPFVQADSYKGAKNILQTYIVPFIIITGLLGNTICFMVFVASTLRRISTSVYLAALAFSDSGFLVCLGIGWLESLGIRLFHKNGICQLTVYFSFVFSFTSIWFVNAFTLEMYIAVFHPRKSSTLCVPKNAIRIVGALSVVAGLIYIYSFWIAQLVDTKVSENKVCLIIPENADTAMILSVLDTVMTLVVPFSMVLFMIVRLLVHISKFYRSELDNSGISVVGDTNAETSDAEQQFRPSSVNHHTVRQASEAHSHLTRMLVVTVIVFIVLNLPSHAIKVQFLFRSLHANVEFTHTESFIQVVFQNLYYANFSVNFLLYSACGKSFRSALSKLMLSLKNGCSNISKTNGLRKLFKKRNADRNSNDHAQNLNDQQHSRLVDIHLNEIRFSQLPSIESQFTCKSPPCLLLCESEHMIQERD